MFDAAPDTRRPWRAWRMDELAEVPAGRGTRAQDGRGRVAVQPEPRDLEAEARKAGHDEGYAAGLAEGHATGYAAGLEEGRAAGQHEFDVRRSEWLEPLAALAHGLRDALDRVDADVGDALVDVALAVGHKLAGDALDAHPEQVRVLIAELLREEPVFTGQPCLRLNPADHALIDAPLADDLAAAKWQVKPDESVARGGCRVTGPEGELNATRETRWHALLARVRRRGSGPIEPAAQDGLPGQTP